MKLVEIIKNDCQLFLKNNTLPLYRGITGGPNVKQFIIKNYYEDCNKLIKFTTNKKRKPRDSPHKLHNISDSFFLHKFDVCYRSESIFTTINIADASEYSLSLNFSGKVDYSLAGVYVVFPINNYKLCYSKKIKDLFKSFNNTYINIAIDSIILQLSTEKIDKLISNDNGKKEYIHQLINYLKQFNTTNRDSLYHYAVIYLLEQAEYQESLSYDDSVKSEIMVSCDEYYLLDMEYYNNHRHLLHSVT